MHSAGVKRIKSTKIVLWKKKSEMTPSQEINCRTWVFLAKFYDFRGN